MLTTYAYVLVTSVRFFERGTTYSGRALIDRCDGQDLDTKLIITHKKGNAVKAIVVGKTDDGVVDHWHYNGFYFAGKRKLILGPQNGAKYAVICDFSEFSDAHASCYITDSDMTKRCGTVQYERDRTGRQLSYLLLYVYGQNMSTQHGTRGTSDCQTTAACSRNILQSALL